MRHSAQVIIYEQTGDWAAALRRVDRRLPLVEVRTLDDLKEQVGESPNSAVIIEVTGSNIRSVLECLLLQHRFRSAAAMTVADRKMRRYEPVLREAGAAACVFSPRRIGEIARLARRQLAIAPRPELTVRQRILAELPWG